MDSFINVQVVKPEGRTSENVLGTNIIHCTFNYFYAEYRQM